MSDLPVLIFESETPERIDRFLASALSVSRTEIQRLIKIGNIKVNDKTVSQNGFLLKTGDCIHVIVEVREPFPLEAIPFALDIIFEDEHLLLVNKPHNMVIHPAPGYQGPTLVHYLLHHFKDVSRFKEMNAERPGIVHRLDRATAGLILIAKSLKVHELLAKAFHDRQIEKTYEAFCFGELAPQGIVEKSIGRDPNHRHRMKAGVYDGRPSVTRWQLIQSDKKISHVRLFPKTGRTHQIRVHLSSIGHPVINDQTYGGSIRETRLQFFPPSIQSKIAELGSTVFFLLARKLHFKHPITQSQMDFEAPYSAEFKLLLSVWPNS